jgi:hypothetical protein
MILRPQIGGAAAVARHNVAQHREEFEFIAMRASFGNKIEHGAPDGRAGRKLWEQEVAGNGGGPYVVSGREIRFMCFRERDSARTVKAAEPASA